VLRKAAKKETAQKQKQKERTKETRNVRKNKRPSKQNEPKKQNAQNIKENKKLAKDAHAKEKAGNVCNTALLPVRFVITFCLKSWEGTKKENS